MPPEYRTTEDTLTSLGLSPGQLRLYTAALRLQRATPQELADAMDNPVTEIADELKPLLALGVIDESSGGYVARHPASALGRLVADRLDQIAAESRQIDDLLNSIDRLTRHYDAGRDYRSGNLVVEIARGVDHLLESVLGYAVQSPPLTLIAAVPDARTMTEVVGGYAGQWIEAQRDGLLRLRVIVPVETVPLPGVEGELTRLTSAGGQVRTLRKVPSWFVAIGEDAAALPVEWGGNLPEHGYNFYLVRSPIVVSALRELFNELWSRALPFRTPTETGNVLQVIRLAAQGLCDEHISRHLGVSVRTVRARFADALADLGAQSRFQAGAEAARRGWLA
ncbi:helix-turn-helix transcriptional regulator [Rhizohabitans arisaemae]|uniref:helix-turn-helix transcriptional regulator n=1 Tax=Rhizohabitans arisaemae TaxID=2720610 RepID=UPI0024B1EA1A|nr:LuxR family transcriptional regulator [Rhizohabitans arisaemae]